MAFFIQVCHFAVTEKPTGYSKNKPFGSIFLIKIYYKKRHVCIYYLLSGNALFAHKLHIIRLATPKLSCVFLHVQDTNVACHFARP